MITSVCWVPRGAARETPVRFELSVEEYDRIKQLAKLEEKEEAEAEIPEAENISKENVDISELPPELRMDRYDEEDYEEEPDDAEEDEFAMMEHGDSALAMDALEDEEEEEEDNKIKGSDSVLVVAMTEDDYSHLEVQVLTEEGSMFVHHDIALPDFPLCLAWLDCPPFRSDDGQGTVGNYIAVGTFDPAIEIWNLDVLDPLEPSAVLGGVDAAKNRSHKKSSKKRFKEGSHTEAVMSLSWNANYRQALASGSADKSVKIWDVTNQSCSHTFSHHTDKVQSVQWHPVEGWILASASFDRSVALLDCRTGNAACTFGIPADVECLAWDPHSPYHLYTAMEDGQIACFDIRNNAGSLFCFQAHKKTVSSLSFSRQTPGLLASASTDKTVRVWDVAHVERGAGNGYAGMDAGNLLPQLVAYKSMNVGKLLTVQFYMDDPFMLATGGDKGMVAVWETDELETIKNHFSGRRAGEQLGGSGNAGNVAVSLELADHECERSDDVGDMEEAVEASQGQDSSNSSSRKKKKKNNKKKKPQSSV